MPNYRKKERNIIENNNLFNSNNNFFVIQKILEIRNYKLFAFDVEITAW